MNKNIIVIPIEVKVREFLPKLYLACKIVANTKFKVYFGGQRFLTKKYSPSNCVVFDKFTYAESRSNAPFHLENRVIMQDEEGPVSYNHISTVKKRYDIRQKKFLDFFLFSGVKDLNLIKYLNLDKTKIKILGLLKLELLRNKNRKFFKKEINEIKKNYKNFLFVPGHSSSYRSKNQTEFLYKEKKFQDVLSDYKNVKKNYYALLDICKKIAYSNPKLTVVFRRHPNEQEDKLLEYLGKIPDNLKIIYKFSVTPWILACDYYLHAGCQTSLEAIMLKKKIVTYMPYKVYGHNNFKLTKPFFANNTNCLKFFLKDKNKRSMYKINNKVKNIAINLKEGVSYDKNFINFLNTSFNYKMFSELKERKNLINNVLKKCIFKILSIIKSLLVKNDIYLSFIPKKYYISKETKEKKFLSIEPHEIKNIIKNFNNIYKKKVRFKKYSDSSFMIYR